MYTHIHTVTEMLVNVLSLKSEEEFEADEAEEGEDGQCVMS